jgi:hypothetical protein
MRGVRERLLAEGFDGYVVKPIVDEGELLETIARLLDTGASSDPLSGSPAIPPIQPATPSNESDGPAGGGK